MYIGSLTAPFYRGTRNNYRGKGSGSKCKYHQQRKRKGKNHKGEETHEQKPGSKPFAGSRRTRLKCKGAVPTRSLTKLLGGIQLVTAAMRGNSPTTRSSNHVPLRVHVIIVPSRPRIALSPWTSGLARSQLSGLNGAGSVLRTRCLYLRSVVGIVFWRTGDLELRMCTLQYAISGTFPPNYCWHGFSASNQGYPFRHAGLERFYAVGIV